VSADESEAAKEDLWLTYQNYDPAVKQAVRRLGALPGNNVEEFRNLLLASRERKRAKEFEADVVRRLQGEAFVDDDVLQQTLIVLHAENPGLAEKFKKFVAANGRPDDIDLTVARLRSGTDDPVMPERMPRKTRETPIMSQLITPEPAPEAIAEIPVPENPAPEIAAPKIAKPVQPPPPSAPVEEKRPRPAPVASEPEPAPIARPVPVRESDSDSRPSWGKRIAAVAAVLVIGLGAVFVLAPDLISGNKPPAFEATNVPLRQAAEEAEPAPVAEPAPAPAPEAEPPAQQTARNDMNIPAPPPTPEPPAQQAARNDVNIPTPPPAVEPPPPAVADAQAVLSSRPVPGRRYRVARGDRLSVIARQAYGDASLYPMIQRANPNVRDADVIYSDQVIILPPRP